MQYTYGFTQKTIHNKQYTYFWKYNGTGQKTETYLGPAGKTATQRAALQTKIQHLENLQEEITALIQQAKDELVEMPEDKKQH